MPPPPDMHGLGDHPTSPHQPLGKHHCTLPNLAQRLSCPSGQATRAEDINFPLPMYEPLTPMLHQMPQASMQPSMAPMFRLAVGAGWTAQLACCMQRQGLIWSCKPPSIDLRMLLCCSLPSCPGGCGGSAALIQQVADQGPPPCQRSASQRQGRRQPQPIPKPCCQPAARTGCQPLPQPRQQPHARRPREQAKGHDPHRLSH